MTKVWIVGGDNGFGNSGNRIFGIYPTKELAKARIQQLKKNGGGTEYMYYQEFTVGVNGGDFVFHVEG